MKYNLVAKKGQMYETEEDIIKINANCPVSEKTGKGPGSCGGGSKKVTDNVKSYSFDPVTTEISSRKKDLEKHLKDAKRFESKGKTFQAQQSKAFADDINKSIIKLENSYKEPIANIPIDNSTTPIMVGDLIITDKISGYAKMSREIDGKSVIEIVTTGNLSSPSTPIDISSIKSVIKIGQDGYDTPVKDYQKIANSMPKLGIRSKLTDAQKKKAGWVRY